MSAGNEVRALKCALKQDDQRNQIVVSAIVHSHFKLCGTQHHLRLNLERDLWIINAVLNRASLVFSPLPAPKLLGK
jgi:hypothetical protein